MADGAGGSNARGPAARPRSSFCQTADNISGGADYGLGYACQREGRFDRLQRRAAMLNRQLGGEGWRTWEDPPTKPKWMRWSTYEKKYERWEQVVERADAEFTLKMMRLLKRPMRQAGPGV